MVSLFVVLSLAGQCCGGSGLAGPGLVGPVNAYPFPQDTVLGVREDPLAAYDDLAAGLYPYGIPVQERGVALQILREARVNQIYSRRPAGPSQPSAPIGPGPVFGQPQPLLRPLLPTPAPQFDLSPLSRHGLSTDTVRLSLDLGDASSGSITLVLVGHTRDLIPAAGEVLVESRRHPRELARFTRAFQNGGGTFDLTLPATTIETADEADAFVVVRIAGIGTASGYAGLLPIRTLAPTQAARLGTSGRFGDSSRSRTAGVVLTSERPSRQAIAP